MKPSYHITTAASLAGAGMAMLTALRWLEVASSGQLSIKVLHHHAFSLLATLGMTALIAAAGFYWTVSRPSRRSAIAVVTSTMAAIVAYAALGTVSRAIENVQPGLWRYVLAAAFVPAALSVFARRIWLAAACLTVGLGLAPVAHMRLTSLGDTLAQAALTYRTPPLTLSLVETGTSLLFLGALIGLCHSALAGGRVQSTLARSSSMAITLAVISWTANTFAYFVATTTGHALSLTCAAITLSWTFLAATVFIAWRAWSVPGGLQSHRLAPLTPALAIAVFCLLSGSGTSAYQHLKRYHCDATHTYIHFSADGTWRRTVDESGSLAKMHACQRFLASYPRSAYRPAALITLAECQYELWNFSAASCTLAQLKRDYPSMGGYADVLAALSHFSAGRPEDLLRPTREDSAFGVWQRTRGALLMGLAAERNGHPRRALGFYNIYVDYMRAQPATSWSPRTLQFTSSRADDTLRYLDAPAIFRQRGTVKLRIFAGADPIPGARVVLVQPHIDAAFPADSMQFAGAWSIPAWNGVWGVSDHQGMVTIHNVPYGTYEVVLGFSLKTCRKGFVIADPVRPVTVSRLVTGPCSVALVPAVTLRLPPAEGTIGRDMRLTWQAYPGAARYSVSVVAADEPRRARRLVPGSTCWARSGITGTSATVDRTHLVGGHLGLQRGGQYMWIVYAYDSAGKLLSSSEHYYQLHEPVFTLP